MTPGWTEPVAPGKPETPPWAYVFVAACGVIPILTLGGAGKSVGRPLEALLAVELDVSSLRGQVLEAAQLVVQGQRRLRQLTRLVRLGHLTKLSRALAAEVPQVR